MMRIGKNKNSIVSFKVTTVSKTVINIANILKTVKFMILVGLINYTRKKSIQQTGKKAALAHNTHIALIQITNPRHVLEQG